MGFTRIALSLGIGFAVLAGLFYFVQITAVRWSVQLGETTGLEQIIQANPLSALAAMNMLGWTLFLGLASLFFSTCVCKRPFAKNNPYGLLAQRYFLSGWRGKLLHAVDSTSFFDD